MKSPLEIHKEKQELHQLPHQKDLTRIDRMKPSSPTRAAATRSPSRLSIINAGIHKHDCELRKELHFQLHAMRLSPHFPHFHSTDMRPESAPSSQRVSNTDAWEAATQRGADVAETPEDFSELEGHESDFEDAECWHFPTADDCEASKKAVWCKAVDCETLPQPSLADQIAPLGSLAMYWSPWESELLQDEFWDSGSDVESDAAGM